MKHSLKKIMVPVLALTTAFAMCIPAYAATSSDEKISTVKLKVSGEEPTAGEDVGTPTVELTSPTAKCSISEQAEYYDPNDDVWERGEIPVIRLELSAADGQRFTSSTKVTVTGLHSDLKAKKVLDSGDTLRVDIKLRKVSGDLEVTSDLDWDGRYAYWEDVEDADKYEVKLYRNGSSVTTVTTSNNRFNFYPYMTRSGDYTFKVRAISNSDGEKSEWSDESDEYYMSSSDVYTGAAPTTTDYTDSGSSRPSPTNGSTGWVQDATGGWFYYENGTALRSSWKFVDNNWFYLGANGYMLTGWQFVDNNWFYLNPVSDGTKGAMWSGWLNLNGTYYYLNPVSDGTKGARKTSYQNIDGKWYFFDITTGAMWANRTVPNGKWANANGEIY